MFGIGLGEFVILAILAIIVLGPEKLPGAARTLGRFVWEIRRAWDEVRDTVREEVMHIQQPLQEVREAGRATAALLREETRKAGESLQTSVQEAVRDLKTAAESATASSTTTTAAETGAKQVQAFCSVPSAEPQLTYFDLDGNPVTPEP